MASPIHLKLTYHCDVRKPIVLDANLRTTRCIQNAKLRNLFTTTAVSEEVHGKVIMVDLDLHKGEVSLVREEEVSLEYECGSFSRTHVKALRPTLDRDYKVIQLAANPTRSVKKWVSIVRLNI